MNANEALARLKAAGTAQNRKVYARHGVGEPMFGVSYAVQGKLAKEIGRDASVAAGLWRSGNHDARVLATMVDDPLALTARELEDRAKQLDNYVLTDALSKLAGQSPHAAKLMRKWRRSKKEWIASLGWNLVGMLAEDSQAIDDAEAGELIETIEHEIHGAPNRTRYSMNLALIQLALRGPRFQKLALDAARRIGPVEVDHGETGCKTPDVVPYVERVLEHRRAKARRKAGKAGKKATRKAGKKAAKKSARR